MNMVEEHICENCPDNDLIICSKLIEAISRKNNWHKEESEKLIYYLRDCISIDEMIENDVQVSDEGLFVYEMHEKLALSNNRSILLELLDEIKPREKDVLLLRFGFTNKDELTLEEVGNIFGLTRERIRQIEAKAIRKLQHPTRIKRLKE